MEELVKQFELLSDDEKVEFFKKIFPTAFNTFKNNPQKLIAEVLPIVMDEFKNSGIDLGQVMAMASMMKN